jgi:hypothetical protein
MGQSAGLGGDWGRRAERWGFGKFIVFSFIEVFEVELEFVEGIHKDGFRLVEGFNINKIGVVQIHVGDGIHYLFCLLCLVGLGGLFALVSLFLGLFCCGGLLLFSSCFFWFGH